MVAATVVVEGADDDLLDFQCPSGERRHVGQLQSPVPSASLPTIADRPSGEMVTESGLPPVGMVASGWKSISRKTLTVSLTAAVLLIVKYLLADKLSPR